MIDLFKNILQSVGFGALPDLADYGIDKRPQRTVKIDDKRTTTAKVVNGQRHQDDVDADGSITTTIGMVKPKTSAEVKIDKFDTACLDFVVGLKWKKDEARAAVIKWHWIQGQSAKQIEAAHTDRQTNELERGFSERSVADYIKAFYDADDERSNQNVPRLRPPRDVAGETSNVIEW